MLLCLIAPPALADPCTYVRWDGFERIDFIDAQEFVLSFATGNRTIECKVDPEGDVSWTTMTAVICDNGSGPFPWEYGVFDGPTGVPDQAMYMLGEMYYRFPGCEQ